MNNMKSFILLILSLMTGKNRLLLNDYFFSDYINGYSPASLEMNQSIHQELWFQLLLTFYNIQ